jgi:hypothetical protein
MTKTTLAILFAALMGTAPAAFAMGAPRPATQDYYRVMKVTMTEDVPTAEEIASSYIDPQQQPHTFSPLTFQSIDWNAMVMIGEKVIDLLKRGQAVVNIKRDSVSVVPAGVTTWQQLSNWQVPVTKVYNFAITNKMGMDVIQLRLKVAAMWGGGINGKGQYLANVNVIPEATRILWGWNLDLWTENHEPVNAGSVESPMAGLGFDIRYKATTLFNEMDGAQAYYLTGNGSIYSL